MRQRKTDKILRLVLIIIAALIVGIMGYIDNRDIEEHTRVEKTSPETKFDGMGVKIEATLSQESAQVRAYDELILKEGAK